MNQTIKRWVPGQLWLVLAFAVANLAMICIFEGICLAPDTPSYVAAVDNYLVHHHDNFRSIGYPLIIFICQTLLGEEAWPVGVVAIQALLFLISVGVMWHTLLSVSRRQAVATVISIYYALAPGISTFVTNILTESPAISFSVFLIASVYVMLSRQEPGKWAPVVFFVSLCALFMLRPASVAVLAAVVVAVAGVFAFKRKCRRTVAVLSAVSLLPLAFQYYTATRTMGVFTSSNVTLINRYNIVYSTGVNFSPDSTDHPLLKEFLGRFEKNTSKDRNSYYEVEVSILHCGAPAVDSLLNRYHSPYYAFGHRIGDALCNYDLLFGREFYGHESFYTPFMTKRTVFTLFRYWLVPLTLLAGCVIFFRRWRRDRPMAVFTLFLLAYLSAVSFTAILYAPDSFDRLTLPASPAMLLLWGLAFAKTDNKSASNITQ